MSKNKIKEKILEEYNLLMEEDTKNYLPKNEVMTFYRQNYIDNLKYVYEDFVVTNEGFIVAKDILDVKPIFSELKENVIILILNHTIINDNEEMIYIKPQIISKGENWWINHNYFEENFNKECEEFNYENIFLKEISN